MLILVGLATFWMAGIRSVHAQMLVLKVGMVVVFSLWLPQIVHNIWRGSHNAIRRKFVVGASLARLVLPLYLYACPVNIFGIEVDTRFAWSLVAYVTAQIILLFAQDTIGPRFFVPSMFLPAVYDYHAVLPEPDIETTAETQPNDCAICMTSVDLFSRNGLVLARGQYMVTPCHHLFHTDCLERWMRVKLECPVCRSPLPPI
jgi:hypothetical protein